MLAVNLAAGAFYEEVLYREFLPETAILLGAGGRLRIAAEVTVIAVFAFSHLYMGIPAVVNAALCGTVLRLCFVKTGSVAAGFLAHFTYNMLVMVFCALV